MLVNAMRPGYLEAIAGFDIGWTFKDQSGTTRTYKPTFSQHNGHSTYYCSNGLGHLYSESTYATYTYGNISSASDTPSRGMYTYFKVGTDSTPPTVDDYNVTDAGNVFSVTGPTKTSTSTYIEYSFTFTATSAVTISEIGMFLPIVPTDATGYSGTYALVARDTFTPITFAAGDAKVIKYRFTNGSTSVSVE